MAAKKEIEASSEALSYFDRMALDRLIFFSDAVFRNCDYVARLECHGAGYGSRRSANVLPGLSIGDTRTFEAEEVVIRRNV